MAAGVMPPEWRRDARASRAKSARTSNLTGEVLNLPKSNVKEKSNLDLEKVLEKRNKSSSRT